MTSKLGSLGCSGPGERWSVPSLLAGLARANFLCNVDLYLPTADLLIGNRSFVNNSRFIDWQLFTRE